MAQKAAQQSQGAQQPRGSDEAGEAESAEEMARAGDSESSIHIRQYFDHIGRTFIMPSHLVGGIEKGQRHRIIYK